MNCIIDSAIEKYVAQGKKLEVVKRYLQIKYKINMDLPSLRERIKARAKNYEFPKYYSSSSSL
jgi:hypothetical protein